MILFSVLMTQFFCKNTYFFFHVRIYFIIFAGFFYNFAIYSGLKRKFLVSVDVSFSKSISGTVLCYELSGRE